jgi:hypothetical protein
MSSNSIYYGRTLNRIPLSSYLTNAPVARGIGGVVRPKNIFFPLKLHIPRVNSTVNALDVVNDKSDFVQDKSKADIIVNNPLDTDKLFVPIKLKEHEISLLKKKKAKSGRRKQDSGGSEVTKSKKRKTDRFSVE